MPSVLGGSGWISVAIRRKHSTWAEWASQVHTAQSGGSVRSSVAVPLYNKVNTKKKKSERESRSLPIAVAVSDSQAVDVPPEGLESSTSWAPGAAWGCSSLNSPGYGQL